MDILSGAASFFLITFSVIGILMCLVILIAISLFCYIIYLEIR